MNTRSVIRWMIALVIALGALSAIGLALSGAPVARATGTTYIYPGCKATLQACINAALPGDVIQIQGGVYTESVNLDKAVSLIGQGWATTELRAEPGKRVLTIDASTSPITFSTVISGLTFSRGSLTAAVCPDGCGGGILITGTARPLLQNLMVANNDAYQGGGLYSLGDVTLTHVLFTDNLAQDEGGGAHVGGLATLYYGRFEHNRSAGNGAGLSAGNLRGQGTWFVDNQATGTGVGDGGGAYVSLLRSGTVDLQNAYFVNNSGYSGGGLFASGLITLTDVVMLSNTAATSGGGVYGGGNVNLIRGLYENNSGFGGTGYGGGGIYAWGPLSMWNVVVHANQTPFSDGGGVYANAPVSIVGGIFADNSAGYWSGGGLYTALGGAIANTTFFSNSAGAGGGVYSAGLLDLTDVTMIKNWVANDNVSTGGAVHSAADVAISGGVYDGNWAEKGGGALYVSGALRLNQAQVMNNFVTAGDSRGGGIYSDLQTSIDRSELTNNSAVNGIFGLYAAGGGLYASGPLTVTRSTFIGNAADDGGGVYHEFSGDARIVNSLFARNQMSQTLGGAALSLNSSGVAQVLHTTIADKALNLGNGINVGGGTLNVTDTLFVNHTLGIHGINGVATEDFNLYFGNITDLAGAVISGLNSLHGFPPIFSDPSKDDYHLRFNSQGLDVGLLLPTVPTDFDGQPRPMGHPTQPDIGFDEVGVTIQQMIDATPVGGTVYVPAGVYTESLTLGRAIDLVGAGVGTPGGTTVHALAGNRVLTVTLISGSDMRVANIRLTGGNVTGLLCPDFCGGGVLVKGVGHATFENVAIDHNSAGLGGGLYIDSGNVDLVSSLVAFNHANQSGGGAYVASNTALLRQTDGSFENNDASDGAGVFVQGGAYFAERGLLTNNFAKNWGGGLLVAGPLGNVTMADSRIISNSTSLTPTARGGGAFVDQGQADLINTLVMSNTSFTGGGVFMSGTLSAGTTLVGGALRGNHALSTGGGLYLASNFNISGTRIFNNRADNNAAVLNHVQGRGQIVNAFIADNQATSIPTILEFGGSAKASILHTTFGNNGSRYGDAVAVTGGSAVTVGNTIFATYTKGIVTSGGAAVEDYNLYFNVLSPTLGAGTAIGSHSLYNVDPMFLNPAAHNFHVRGFSPAVNHGKDVGVKRDVDFDLRPLGGRFDIGADEVSVAGATVHPTGTTSFTYSNTFGTQISMVFPPGAVTDTVPIYCTLVPSDTAPPPPNGLKFAGVLFELDAETDTPGSQGGSISFNTAVTLTFKYTDTDWQSANITDEHTLKLYRFETSVNDWEPIGYRAGETQTLDVNNNTITATLLGLSKFGGYGPSAVYDIYLPIILRNP